MRPERWEGALCAKCGVTARGSMRETYSLATVHLVSNGESYWAVLTSPAHLLAELTVTAVTDGLLYPLVRLAVRRHDRKEHSL